MNKAEELLASLERRGLKVTLHPQGGVAITPTDQLTDDDRAQLRHAAAGLERLLRQRSALINRAVAPQPCAEIRTPSRKPSRPFPPARSSRSAPRRAWNPSRRCSLPAPPQWHHRRPSSPHPTY